MTSAMMPEGFVLHKLEPAWIARGSRLSAWFDLSGKMLDAELINSREHSRAIPADSPLWNYAEREGQKFAATLTPSAKP